MSRRFGTFGPMARPLPPQPFPVRLSGAVGALVGLFLWHSLLTAFAEGLPASVEPADLNTPPFLILGTASGLGFALIFGAVCRWLVEAVMHGIHRGSLSRRGRGDRQSKSE